MKKKINSIVLKFMTLIALIGFNSSSIADKKNTTSKADIEQLKAGAKENNKGMQLALGLAYLSGNGVKQDYKKAKELFQKSSDQGVSESTNMLAIMYLNGLGVVKDEKKAIELFNKAKAMKNIT